MNVARFLTAAALLFSFATVAQAAPPTHWVAVWVSYKGKPVYNAIVTITDRESPPEHYTGHTGPDGIYRFAVWPNVKSEICFRAQLRTSPHTKSSQECFQHPYPNSITLAI
jgi:hypothetical protein